MQYYLWLTCVNHTHKNTEITEGYNVELHELHDVTKEKEIPDLLVLLQSDQGGKL